MYETKLNNPKFIITDTKDGNKDILFYNKEKEKPYFAKVRLSKKDKEFLLNFFNKKKNNIFIKFFKKLNRDKENTLNVYGSVGIADFDFYLNKEKELFNFIYSANENVILDINMDYNNMEKFIKLLIES